MSFTFKDRRKVSKFVSRCSPSPCVESIDFLLSINISYEILTLLKKLDGTSGGLEATLESLMIYFPPLFELISS
jgi:hypothetical protein